MNTPALRLTDVVRTHGGGDTLVHALRGVSMEVWPGELVAVMGPSGSGKSTLLNLAGALDRPTSGEVAIDGVTLNGLKPEQLAQLRGRGARFYFQHEFADVEILHAPDRWAVGAEICTPP